ncbi:tRNA 2-thiocytidine(32) synthetase TtcA [Ostreibacterium oceani]|uniref:tRNA-cytidine(32) 2-sulfurtransferase n=1 Tax=Ostreibacterium oceani TaxID=2654998 RepID=A0A6N7F0D0_9GAMM|nr:tRNA 2-thiocytidine(32) synthetase TtcA [Ostreibacterium oceani]MPV86857.1 tRNA 2-thiocytidine(32) synthetase TtcA [Ostreibacterium oceani]
MSSVNSKKLQKRIRRLTATAIEQYQMIAAGDKIMVCLSGGKDSYAMLDMLMNLQRKAPVDFELLAVNLNQVQPGFDETILPSYLAQLGVPFDIITEDTYSIVTDKIPAGKTMCSLCSRLRRGILYTYAKANGVTKIALGHHKDDILETFFLNLFFGGRLKTMPPKLRSDDGHHVVIRPLALVDEQDLIAYAKVREFPIIPCNLCGSQENLQRKHIKAMLTNWEKEHPNRKNSLFSALSNVSPSHLLDTSLFDFGRLTRQQTVDTESAISHRWLLPERHQTASTDDVDTVDMVDKVERSTRDKTEQPIVFRPT